MPVYDSVLGSHLEVAGVDAASVDEATELFETARSNDLDLSASDRANVVAKLVRIAGVRAAFAMEGDEGDRWLDVIADGRKQGFAIRESRAPASFEAPRGARGARVRLRDGFEIDDVLDVLRDAGIEDLDADDDGIELPFHWNDATVMTTALAAIAPMLRRRADALVEIDGRRYDVAIDTAKVTSVALFSVSDEPGHASRFLELARLPNGDAATATPSAARGTQPSGPAFDPARPLTTGSAKQREAAWFDANDWREKRVIQLDLAVAAVRDPANRSERYAKLRGAIYHHLAKRDVAKVHDTFLWALREEDDATVETVIYIGWKLDGLIARLPAEIIAAADDDRLIRRIKRLMREAGISAR